MKATYEFVERCVNKYLVDYGYENISDKCKEKLVKIIWNNCANVITEQMSDTYKVLIRGFVNAFIQGELYVIDKISTR